MPQFDSGAAKQIGRFSEGLLLRLLHLGLKLADDAAQLSAAQTSIRSTSSSVTSSARRS
jgi:hypothetical protein